MVRSDVTRVRSLDVIRGAVMVFMALDHVRWFLSNGPVDPTNLSQTTVPYFLTRWVTHFCAPAFVFLAGTSAYLHGHRLASRPALARFLITRGAWLILLEMTVIRLAWTFNFDYAHYVLGGVIWMIGWCMILLAGLVFLPTAAIATFGLGLIAGHNLLDQLAPAVYPALRQSPWAWLWQILYYGGRVSVGPDGPRLAVLFSLVPWAGVMAAGYAFGPIVRLPSAVRRARSLQIGLASITAFVVLRTFNIYGNPWDWSPQPTVAFSVLSFLNTAKYPASLLFLLMTLGPTIALMPALDRAGGSVARILEVFGRVPFFFYVLHIPFIHGVAVLLSLVRYGAVVPWLRLNHPMGLTSGPPDGWGYGLPLVYLITAILTAAIYLPCRWFAGVKRARRDWWLSFL